MLENCGEQNTVVFEKEGRARHISKSQATDVSTSYEEEPTLANGDCSEVRDDYGGSWLRTTRMHGEGGEEGIALSDDDNDSLGEIDAVEKMIRVLVEENGDETRTRESIPRQLLPNRAALLPAGRIDSDDDVHGSVDPEAANGSVPNPSITAQVLARDNDNDQRRTDDPSNFGQDQHSPPREQDLSQTPENTTKCTLCMASNSACYPRSGRATGSCNRCAEKHAACSLSRNRRRNPTTEEAGGARATSRPRAKTQRRGLDHTKRQTVA